MKKIKSIFIFVTLSLSKGLIARGKTCILLALASCFLLLTNSCKKYPEDDKRYWFKSPVCRLYNPSRKWEIYRYYINGSDSTNNSRQLIFITVSKYKTGINFNSGGVIIGSMELVNNKNTMRVTISLINGYTNPFLYPKTDWKIKELTEKVLKISASFNGINYDIIFTD